MSFRGDLSLNYLLCSEGVETLIELGLTERQAKVYLAILQTGPSKAEVISKVSSVHRQEVYRIVIGLQEIGLIEVYLSSPTLFKAIPLSEAIEMLSNKKTKKLNESLDKAQQLILQFNDKSKQKSSFKEDSSFVIASGNIHQKKCLAAIKRCCESISFISSWKQSNGLFFLLEGSLNQALKRGAMIEVITEKSNDMPRKGPLQMLTTGNRSLSLRTTDRSPTISMAIFDNNEVALSTGPVNNFKGPYLWSNNSTIIGLSKRYFDCEWEHLKS